MARKATAKNKPAARNKAAATSEPSASRPADPRHAAIEALMRLVVARDWEGIELGDIAAEAGMDLIRLRGLFPSKAAMLGGFARMIDEKVLTDANDDLAEEPLRERLFDVVMRRLDAMTPYKAALAKLLPELRRRPLDLVAMNGVALNSWRYMLASIDVPTEDDLGGIRLQGTVLLFSRVLETWVADDDPGLARTMARLDRELDKAGRIMGRFEDFRRLTAPLRGALRALCTPPAARRRARAERYEPGDDAPANAI